jgi:hypothetical protein
MRQGQLAGGLVDTKSHDAVVSAIRTVDELAARVEDDLRARAGACERVHPGSAAAERLGLAAAVNSIPAMTREGAIAIEHLQAAIGAVELASHE